MDWIEGAIEIPTAIGISERLAILMAMWHWAACAGQTTHYETVCNDSSRALTMLGLQGLCIGNGILTVENMDQATVRAEASGQNKGAARRLRPCI